MQLLHESMWRLVKDQDKEELHETFALDTRENRLAIFREPEMVALRAALIGKYSDTQCESRVTENPSVSKRHILERFDLTDPSQRLGITWLHDKGKWRMLWIHGTPPDRSTTMIKKMAEYKQHTCRPPSVVLSYFGEQPQIGDGWDRTWESKTSPGLDRERMVKSLLRQLYNHFPGIVDRALVKTSVHAGCCSYNISWGLGVAHDTLIRALKLVLREHEPEHRIWIFLDRPHTVVPDPTDPRLPGWQYFEDFVDRLRDIKRVKICVAHGNEDFLWEKEQSDELLRIQTAQEGETWEEQIRAWKFAPVHSVGLRLAALPVFSVRDFVLSYATSIVAMSEADSFPHDSGSHDDVD